MMDGRETRRSAFTNPPMDGTGNPVLTVLAIALHPDALGALPKHVLSPNAKITAIDYAGIEDATLTGADAPDLILSPLLSPKFDALDLARHLTEREFAGRYLALVARLPSANLIRREVQAQSPGLNFDVMVLDGTSVLHSL